MASMTLRELAALAGCSHSTVSLALRDHPRIPLPTRERIHALAREHGYTQDPVVSSLMTRLRTTRKARTTEKLGFLNMWAVRDPNHYTASIFIGAAARARELGYELDEFWAKEPGMTGKRLTKILYTRAIRGLIVGSLLRPKGHIAVDWRHFATVALSQTLVRPNHHRIVSSKSHGIDTTLRALKHLGYQRIAFAGLLDECRRSNSDWLAGYMLDHFEKPAKHRINPLLLEHWELPPFEKWLRQHRPEAVVSNSYRPLEYLRELGYQLPADIGFATLDHMSYEQPCAGMDQLRQQMGAAAVDLVVSLIERNQFGIPEHPKIMHLEGFWTDGPTVRRINQP